MLAPMFFFVSSFLSLEVVITEPRELEQWSRRRRRDREGEWEEQQQLLHLLEREYLSYSTILISFLCFVH